MSTTLVEQAKGKRPFPEERLANFNLLPCAVYTSSPAATVLTFFELGPPPEFDACRVPSSPYLHRYERLSSLLLLSGRVLGSVVAIVCGFTPSGVFAAIFVTSSLFLTLALALGEASNGGAENDIPSTPMTAPPRAVFAPVSRPVDVEKAAPSTDDGLGSDWKVHELPALAASYELELGLCSFRGPPAAGGAPPKDDTIAIALAASKIDVLGALLLWWLLAAVLVTGMSMGAEASNDDGRSFVSINGF
ncbi:hypothetical protein M407DRAFT_32568 [Tulasnella calospora MUT 4182]|uniref:Uncharacterized protein n=1 Tax=Tulasnella calospora MUT 4182 TaxID=1051891 RepID=A0A0C3Q3Q7_9AGAM|nr:hypothetical protein M407DRAFT_32568 [Tulasnella calospora MUT 4182]